MEDFSLLSKSVNTAMLVVIAFGLWYRHRPKIHIPAMVTAFVVDLANVLWIEIYARSRGDGKGAVEQGIDSFTGDGRFIEQFHITVSTLCIVSYVVAIITGTILYRRNKGRGFHKLNACVFLLMRLASYVTSFWMGG